ncbi:hypothetical protein BRD03_02735 [Halobacteriales archaeon QS_9_68_17]|nr:MAG: hypothetical protein BRD03_02735 [Halobacteriales archaeon QS_9_68_17]
MIILHLKLQFADRPAIVIYQISCCVSLSIKAVETIQIRLRINFSRIHLIPCSMFYRIFEASNIFSSKPIEI